jgi:hypothetical protein
VATAGVRNNVRLLQSVDPMMRGLVSGEGGRSWYWPALLTVVSLGTSVCALVHRHLFADGGHFLIGVLERQGFTTFDTPRQFAHYVLQAPLVVAINWFRVTDVRVLSWVFGLTLFMLPVASLWVCWRLVRLRNRALMLLPALSWVCLMWTTSFFMVSEGWVGASLFWPIYFLLHFKQQRLGVLRGVTLVVCSFAAVRVYEAFFIPAMLLVFLAVRRLRWQWRIASRCDGWTGVSLLCLAGTVILGVYWALFPRDPVNRLSLVGGLAHMAVYPSALLVVAALLILVGPRTVRARTAGVGPRLLVVVALAWALTPWFCAACIQPAEHVYLRMLTSLLPLALGSLPLLATLRGQLRPTIGPIQKRALAGLVLAMLVWQWGASWAWLQYTRRFSRILATSEGWLPLASTEVARDVFNWSWTMPTMSVVLRAMARAPMRAIVLNGSNARYQPMDPTKPESLPRLERYGLVYQLPAPAPP